MASIPQPPKAPEVKYVDLPDLGETFADSVRFIGFDGQTWRIELTVTRLLPELLNPAKPGPLQDAQRQYPALRLVLPINTGLELVNKLTQTMGAMEAQGLIKKNEPPKPSMVMPDSKGPH